MASQQIAQLLPGPIDQLMQGVLAGSRLASMRAQRESLKIRNQLLEDQFESDERVRAGEGLFRNAQISKIETDIAFTKDREAAARQLEPLLQRQAAARATQEEALAGTAKERAGIPGRKEARETTAAQTAQTGAELAQTTALIQSLRPVDDDFTPQEASALLETNLPRLEEVLGKPIKVGDTTFQFLASQLLNETRQINEEFRIEEKKAESLSQARMFQGIAAMSNASTREQERLDRAERLDPARQEMIKQLGGRIESLRDKLQMFNLGVAVARNPEEKARAQEALDSVNRELEESLVELQNFGVETEDQGLPVVKTDEDYKKLPSGTEYIDPDGKKRRKR